MPFRIFIRKNVYLKLYKFYYLINQDIIEENLLKFIKFAFLVNVTSSLAQLGFS